MSDNNRITENQSAAFQTSSEILSSHFEEINSIFKVYEINRSDDLIYLYGTPLLDINTIYRRLWTVFNSKGYQISFTYEPGEYIMVISPVKKRKERVWINIVLAVATFFTTMIAGSAMYGVDFVNDPAGIIKGLPFTLAIMTVLGSHEMGHYVAARIHGMNTSLPYFIPFPTIIGTMGAMISHRGPIPDRKSLFDVGVSGPIIGLIASVIVTVIGLSLEPVSVPVQDGSMIEIQLPLMFTAIMNTMGVIGETIHPIAFAGWVGMFITVLNLMPAGQLDGGHAIRAMIGDRARYISSITPFVLLLLGIYVTYVMESNGFIWVMWAILLSFFAAAGHPSPLDDESRLDGARQLIGIVTFVLGITCFTLVPFTIV